MLQVLFRKWWVVLLQGILLIILSIYIFQNPVAVLAGISFWCGLLVLAAGVLGIIAWLAADKGEREGMSLFWSILTAAFGLLMLLHLLVTMKTLTVIFAPKATAHWPSRMRKLSLKKRTQPMMKRDWCSPGS